jgi:hypothetical protein
MTLTSTPRFGALKLGNMVQFLPTPVVQGYLAFIGQFCMEAGLGLMAGVTVDCREKEIGGSGGSLEPPGPLPTHLHTVYMAYSECLPTRLNPLAERACFSQVDCTPLSDNFSNGGCSNWAQVRKTPSWPRSWASCSLL